MNRKIITIIALTAASILPLSAQVGSFKTYLDFHAGTTMATDGVTYNDNWENIYDDGSGYAGSSTLNKFRPALTFGMNVTGGYQITSMLFAGVGFGGYAVMTRFKERHESYQIENGAPLYDYYYSNWSDKSDTFSNILFPFYANVRWTLDIEKPITPFVDLKIGYQASVYVNDNENIWFDSSSYPEYGNGKVDYSGSFYCVPSVGVRFGRTCGFNLGIAYNMNMPRTYTQYRRSDNTYVEKGHFSKGVFMLTLGADF